MRGVKGFGRLGIMSREDARKTKADIARSEFVVAAMSFALPFLMALAYAAVEGVAIARVFEKAHRYAIGGVALFVASNAVIAFVFSDARLAREGTRNIRMFAWAIGIAYLASVVAASVSAYCVPICLVGLLIALLIDRKLALFANCAFVVLFYFFCVALADAANEPAEPVIGLLGAMIAQCASGCFVILLSKEVYTRMSYFVDSVLVGALVAFPLAFLIGLADPAGSVAIATRRGVWACVSSAFGLALFTVVLPVFEYAFRTYSNFRFDEICSPEAPLMMRLATEAPGTYNHSLAMANLAQACAMAIGENVALARAAACYHDVGKLKNPICFTENQTDYNPHDDYIPEVSVSIITRHTRDGARLIRECKLPECLARIAEEHHGTTTVGFFLNKTRGFTDADLAQSDFSYRGPLPSTKISGLTMIVDTVEAATRAQGVDKDATDFAEFIHGLVMSKMRSGQFAECPLTLKDLRDIEATLTKTLPSLYHERVKYAK